MRQGCVSPCSVWYWQLLTSKHRMDILYSSSFGRDSCVYVYVCVCVCVCVCCLILYTTRVCVLVFARQGQQDVTYESRTFSGATCVLVFGFRGRFGPKKAVLGHKMRSFGRAPPDLAPPPRGTTGEVLA